MKLLGRHGAKAVGLAYEGREPVGLTFRIKGGLGEHAYDMPLAWKGTHLLLKRAQALGLIKTRTKPADWYVTEDHARAVAWRQLRDWLESTLSLIEAGLWQLEEVMLPWQLVAPGERMFAAVIEQERKALTS
jgi:hypothetical protein